MGTRAIASLVLGAVPAFVACAGNEPPPARAAEGTATTTASVAPAAPDPAPPPLPVASTEPARTSTPPAVTATSDPAPPPSGPVKDKDDAVARALPAANAALARAYAAFAKTAEVAPAHPEPWVRAERAEVTGDARRGFQVRWSSFPPAGDSYEAIVDVSPAGKVSVKKATASFSPD